MLRGIMGEACDEMQPKLRQQCAKLWQTVPRSMLSLFVHGMLLSDVRVVTDTLEKSSVSMSFFIAYTIINLFFVVLIAAVYIHTIKEAADKHGMVPAKAAPPDASVARDREGISLKSTSQVQAMAWRLERMESCLQALA